MKSNNAYTNIGYSILSTHVTRLFIKTHKKTNPPQFFFFFFGGGRGRKHPKQQIQDVKDQLEIANLVFHVFPPYHVHVVAH